MEANAPQICWTSGRRRLSTSRLRRSRSPRLTETSRRPSRRSLIGGCGTFSVSDALILSASAGVELHRWYVALRALLAPRSYIGPHSYIVPSGKSFGSFVTHESKHFLYFYINDVGVLLFR